MKIKRFFAKDIRQAMRMVKDELGADAVIMSNRTVDGGVEIVAAQDFDAQALQTQASPAKATDTRELEQASTESKKPALTSFEAAKKHLHLLSSSRKQNTDTAKQGSDLYAAERPAPARPKPSRLDVEQYVGYAEKIQLRSKPEPSIAPVSHFEPPVSRPRVNPDLKAPEQPETLSNQLSDKLLIEMSMELKSLRAAFDAKLSGAFNASAPTAATPFRMDLLKKLMGMSISKRLGIKIANQLSDLPNTEMAFVKAQELLAKSLPIAEDDLLENGGIAALVGPTGAGKTTTIAKLAAKFILRHGSRQVALITTDNYRIGAYEQLNTYGRILDVPVRVATNPVELHDLIHSFSDKRLILIDTAGMSQRDMKLAEQINTLKQSNIPIRSYLVMSAATEYKAMNEIIKAFKIFEPQASILTKLDESATLGAAISSITEQNLPLFFITDGQQVPEDLHKPCARSLVKQCAAELHKENDYTDDLDDSLWVAQGYA